MTANQDGESIDNLVDYILALPPEFRLEVLRRLAPPILAELRDEDRGAFVHHLNSEIASALAGVRVVDRR